MDTKHTPPAKKSKRLLMIVLPSIVTLAGIYLLITTLAPSIYQLVTPATATQQKLSRTQPDPAVDRLYVPSVNIDTAIVQSNGNQAAALLKGAVQRSPSSGNPKDGGNFVLAGHRLDLGVTPQHTIIQSPFYSIDKVKEGDDIYVDYKGVRYHYRVREHKRVPPTAVEIEERTADDRLTFYTCDLSGSAAPREVIMAAPVFTKR